MPFLWKYSQKLLINLKRPSPKHDREIAREKISIEKALLLTSMRIRISAGMTVEAAMVLPIFLLFFFNLSSAIEMIRLHGNLELALWNTGNKICLYGYVLDREEKIGGEGPAKENAAWWDTLAGITLSYTYIKSEMINFVGEDYLKESPLSDGTAGLQFWESDIPNTDDTVDILVTYKVSPWAKIPFVLPFRMQNRYYGHLWTGYALLNPNAEEEAADVVYITDNASVYHERLDCTHLKLTIREVTIEEAKSSRNESGGRYKECSKCRGRPFLGIVFIGREGDFYHYDRGCPGLKRTIHTITRQQAKGYRSCSRCGK